jgi:hypothetical protein
MDQSLDAVPLEIAYYVNSGELIASQRADDS